MSEIKPYRYDNLPFIKDNRHFTGFYYKSKRSVTEEKAAQTGYNMREKLFDAMRKKGMDPQQANMRWTISILNKQIGWRTGGWSKITDDLKFYDPTQVYGDDFVSPYPDPRFNKFYITVESNVKRSGGCSPGSVTNDCLFDCIKLAYNANYDKKYLPSGAREAYQIKKMCSLERNDKVPIEKLHIIENKMRLNISVSGDVERASPCKYAKHIHLRLIDGHYSLGKSLKGDELTVGMLNKPAELVVFMILPDGKIICHDGKQEFEVNALQLRKMSNEYSRRRIQYEKNICLEAEYHKQRQITAWLKYASDGIIDLNRFRSLKGASLYLFHLKSGSIPSPEPMGEIESKWIDFACGGGITYPLRRDVNKSLGEKHLPYGISYDINRMYFSLYESKHLGVPMSAGEFSRIAELPSPLKFGIYRVNIREPSGSWENPLRKLFRFKNNEYYTQMDVQTALDIGLDVTMVMDDEANVCFYRKRLLASEIFAQYTDFVRMIEEKSLDQESYIRSAVKKMRNSLWGALMQKNNKTIAWSSAEAKSIDLENFSVDHVYPMQGENAVVVDYINYVKRFQRNWARIGPFITARARRMMYQVLAPHAEHIHRIHTDGFVSDCKLPLDIGSEVGQWKVEHEGECTIYHCNRVDWVEA